MGLLASSSLALLLITLAQQSLGQDLNGTAGIHRSPKVFSLFNVVTWKQTACQATTSATQYGTDGTCMTSAQCSSTSGGAASGTCAAGFGVCCVVSLNSCGGTITQNCTYVINPGYPSTYDTAGTCQYTIKKCSSNICMIRLDFDQFTISAPNTLATAGPTLGVCAIDSFTATPVIGGQSRPVICGDNTGQHMYLNAVSGSSADLGFAIAIAQTTIANNLPRKWIIKITQLPCGRYTPDSSCTQYFTGKAGTIKSYDYGSASFPISHMLASQDYHVCVRQEDNTCQIAYSTCPNDPNAFTVMGSNSIQARNGKGCTKNWIGIVGGHNADSVCKTNGVPTPNPVYRYCGLLLNCFDQADNNNVIYSDVQPFGFYVSTETLAPTAITWLTSNAKGFCLNYNQLPC